jgi:hypothetical protein
MAKRPRRRIELLQGTGIGAKPGQHHDFLALLSKRNPFCHAMGVICSKDRRKIALDKVY